VLHSFKSNGTEKEHKKVHKDFELTINRTDTNEDFFAQEFAEDLYMIEVLRNQFYRFDIDPESEPEVKKE